mgnify:CR=1 FL=1
MRAAGVARIQHTAQREEGRSRAMACTACSRMQLACRVHGCALHAACHARMAKDNVPEHVHGQDNATERPHAHDRYQVRTGGDTEVSLVISVIIRVRVLRDKEEQAASHERALVDQHPGIGALHRLHELDAPFPDEWAPPFPIGFACLCPSSQSRHSHRGALALC